MAEKLSGLVDEFGYALPASEAAVLQSEIAAPSSFGARPPFAGHIAFGIDPGRLGMIVRGADAGQTREWFILAEEIEELFPHYASVLGKRRRQVSLLPMTVEAAESVPDGEKHADLVRRWLETEVLERAFFDITDALGKGFSASEMIWDCGADHVWPAEILWRNPRDFELSSFDGQTLWLRDAAGFLNLAPHKFLLHVHQSKSGNPVRSGLTRMVCWLWMYSTYTLKDWALFVQGYGLPWRIGRYGPEASDADKRTLFRAVRNIGGDMAGIVPKSMEIELVEPKGTSSGELFTGRANWLNYEVSKLVLGGTAATDAIKGGHAVGQEHRAGEQDVEKFDAKLLGGSINRQIIPAIIAFTYGEQKAYPRVKIGVEEQVPLSDVIAAVADLGPLGFKVKAEELRDRLQLTKPEGDDEVIGPPPPPPPGAAGAAGAEGLPAIAKAAIAPKPNPHPEINPSSDERALMTRLRRMRTMVAAHASEAQRSAGVLDALVSRVTREAGGAISGMTDEIRACFDAADDMHDLAERLAGLKLDDKEFAQAMTQAMALAHLAGQSELLDEIAPAGR